MREVAESARNRRMAGRLPAQFGGMMIRTGMNRQVMVAAAVVVGVGLVVPSAQALDGTWSGADGTGLWGTAANWSALPNYNGKATFNGAGNGQTTLDLGTSKQCGEILFDTANAAAYTIGAGAASSQTFVLYSYRGKITMNSSVTNDQLFNAKLNLGNGANSDSFTVTNNSTTNTLGFAGSIGVYNTTVSNLTETLTFSGTGDITVSGAIERTVVNYRPADVKVNKSGVGTLTLTNQNTYQGTTTISGGTLAVTGSGALTGTSGVTVGSGATFDYSSSTPFSKPLTVSAGGMVTGSGALNTSVSVTGGTISGTGLSATGITFNGTGNSFTGTASAPVTVAASGALNVSGTLIGSVTLDSGSILSGSGRVGQINGGLVSPGNSPGILTASQLDPAGQSYAFEFGSTGSPVYSNALASTNDVLDITGTSPFGASLTSSNDVSVYLKVGSIADGDVFRGGWYLDTATADFSSSIKDASYHYYVMGDGSGTDATFNGQGYYSLASFSPQASIVLATIAEMAQFAGGSRSGYVTEFTVTVPEPSTLLSAAVGGLAVLSLRRPRGVRRAMADLWC